jgi:hypothetical protein
LFSADDVKWYAEISVRSLQRTMQSSMSNVAGKLGRRSSLGIFALLLFGFAGLQHARAAGLPNEPIMVAGAGPQFAIADLDGDLRPDSASIQADANILGGTSYRIQLRLSGAGQQTVQLVGPAGGLRIEARDVNGDDAVDLVLSTAWLGRPVAILLNDGQGRFSRVEPAAFPGAFSGSKTSSVSGTSLAMDAVGLPSQSSGDIDGGKKQSTHDRLVAKSASLCKTSFARELFFVSHAGRAPPVAVPYL